MLLKFKVQRRPIIPAGSWDKNPIVQHAELWCCSLLLISFYWKGKKTGRRINKETQSSSASPARFQHPRLSKRKGNRWQTELENIGKTEIWRQNHPLGCQTCPGMDVSAWESCGAAAQHGLERGTGQGGGDAAAEQPQSICSRTRPVNTKYFPQSCSTALGALDT